MTEAGQALAPPRAVRPRWNAAYWLIAVGLGVLVFEDAVMGLWGIYTRIDSYYTHGPLVPLVSAFFVWRKRSELRSLSLAPHWSGVVVLAGACVLTLLGDFLGFRIFGQVALPLSVAGLLIAAYGWVIIRVLWFPLAFLVFMIPIPDSITQSLVLNVKLFATEAAVRLAHLVSLPMIRDGSYVVFGDDRLLVGEVCGGLRSLIALLALGAVMSYISQSKAWARCLLFVLAVPFALAANIVRIFFLCVVAYFWGSERATGAVHDISGILIYAIALALFLSAEYFARRFAPARDKETTSS